MIWTSFDCYEVGACGQYINDDGEVVAKNFEGVAEALDQKVSEICSLVWATEEPICFLSMDARTKKRNAKRIEKRVKRVEKELHSVITDGGDNSLEKAKLVSDLRKEVGELKEQQVYHPNFREAVAKKKEYKVGRKGSVKPLHYDNLTEYILATYECVMAEGLEADDLLSVYQCKALAKNPDPTTIICSRDKDLKMVPGMHFSWECGKQKQFGPVMVKGVGMLKPIYGSDVLSRGPHKGEHKIEDLRGLGLMFFGAQLIMGDSTDDIPGIPGQGKGAAYYTLRDVKTEEEMFKAVKELYVKKFGDDWGEELLEQGRLLWMVNELNEDGSPVMWEIPECLN